MALIVQKYGGKVVSTKEQLQRIAHRLIELYNQGHKLVVVTSAPADLTDQLISTAQDWAKCPSRRELDALLAIGERRSATALAIIINDLAGKDIALSFTGSQAGIITDDNHGSARILEVRGERIQKALEHNKIVIVAGFQGYSPKSDSITTLGRGGSDLTAVALAAALGANRCELYKDVEGIFTADPHQIDDAWLLQVLDYDEALALSRAGMKVIQANAVEMAKDKRVPIAIGSAESGKIGTLISRQEFSYVTVTAITLQTQMKWFRLNEQTLDKVIKLNAFPKQILFLNDSAWILSSMDESAIVREATHTEGEDCEVVTAIGSGLYPGAPATRELLIEIRNLALDYRLIFTAIGLVQCIVPKGYGNRIVKIWHQVCVDNGWLPAKKKQVRAL
ncbi:MAG: aspartate kinase [bacterium]|nr:aspartate kinase [bacterium]